jgi:hypothetical protein
MFLFYETAFYFLRTYVLVIKIVIICFKKHGTAGRDKAQQKGALSPLFAEFFRDLREEKPIKKPPQGGLRSR